MIFFNVQNWIAFDQWVNATFFNGWADETLSARAYRNAVKGNKKWDIIMRGINILFFWQNHHCRGAYAQEQKRMHMPPEYRV